MKNSKKLRLKKEIVEALTPIAARYVQGGCSKGEITVISKDCGNKTQKCTLDCSLGTPSAYTCAEICGGSVVRCIGDLE